MCLGSQLLAHALGACVAPASFLELGWLATTLLPEARSDALLAAAPAVFSALHWHGDAFELPRGAVALARSDRTPLQAFRYARAWGILFHLEVDAAQVAAMSRAFPGDLSRAGLTEERLDADSARDAAAAHRLGLEVFGRFARLALDL